MGQGHRHLFLVGHRNASGTTVVHAPSATLRRNIVRFLSDLSARPARLGSPERTSDGGECGQTGGKAA